MPQCVPFQISENGTDAVDVAKSFPTATQLLGDVHDTESNCRPAGDGVALLDAMKERLAAPA
jgi:hypothetical protein